ncbi:hypothetical protein [Pseudomonas frederiksbergensis]|uniref:Uncharacterized protein n=1 Tax=Pseudomonas frederiksbergensis TaxID=104087 RepID=A0A6L5BYT0_9PSED|nr:hypothetical protein [Pseudomonas frederiksbergensis]KAF2393771.1 hypothetical protein FX983_01741 [Pseudomonas frederiksbergensis]
MNNIKSAKIINISDINEEHITLLIDGFVVECFVNSCPYAIQTGETYDIELSLDLLDTYTIKKAPDTNALIEKKPEGYSYILSGTLRNDVFESFTAFFDEDVHYDHPDLNDHFICLEVNRINVSFV